MAARRGDAARRDTDDEHVVDQEFLEVVVHSSPRYGRFLGIGVGVGLLVATVLTIIAGVTDEGGGPVSTGAGGILRVFALYAGVAVALGLLIMGLLAMMLDRRSLRRARAAHAEHATTLVMDLDSPVTDDVPLWVRDADDLSGPR
jgi:hypothetical protein